MTGKNQAILLLATMVIAINLGISSAASYTVGGNTGWTIPTSSNLYSNWASQHTFQVGDVLVFNFPAGAHTVAQVNKANFDGCGTTNTIGQVQTTSPANITLTTAGTHYFICTISGHCAANQKLSVVVTGPSATTPASAPAPARIASSPATTPSPTGVAPAIAPAATPTTTPTPAIAPSPVGVAPSTAPAAASTTTPTPATAPSPTTITPATAPAITPTTTPTSATSPSTPTDALSNPTTPAPSSPAADAPAGNFATCSSTSLLNLVSVAIATLFILYCY